MERSEHPFDRDLKEKLDQFQPPDVPDWAHMQKKWNDALAEENAFDQELKNILDSYQPPSKGVEWEDFVAKSKRQSERRKKIITARLIESTLLLLLLWTLDNIGLSVILRPQDQPESRTIQAISAPPSIAQTDGALQPSRALLTDDFASDKQTPTQKGNSHSASSTQRQTGEFTAKPRFFENANRTIRSGDPSSSNHIPVSENKNQTSLHDVVRTNPIPLETTASISSEIPAIADESYAPLNTASQAIERANFSNETESEIAFAEILSGPVRSEASEWNILQPLPELSAAPRKIKPLPVRSLEMNLHSGVMANTVISPSFITGESQYQYQLHPGFQSGISIGIRNGHWMLESGLNYHHLSYQPNQSETLGSWDKGYYKILFSGIESRLVSIPVLLHRTLLRTSNWDLSAKLGLSIAAALKNNFSVDTITNLSGTTRPGISFTFNEESQIVNRVRNASNQGLLDGGNFGTNSFANAVAGIRFRQQIAPRLHYFAEAEVQKMLGKIGFGPNGDRFISTNFNVGISLGL